MRSIVLRLSAGFETVSTFFFGNQAGRFGR